MAGNDSDDVVVRLDFGRRTPVNRGTYVDAESCAAMMIACIAAAGGAPSDIVTATSPFMEHLVTSLGDAAAARTTFRVDVALDNATITINFDGSTFFVDTDATSTSARMAKSAIASVLREWSTDPPART